MKSKKIANHKTYLLWPITLCLVLFTHTSMAAPFGMFDARTMAMGGVGVATGSQYAAFNNPALLSTADEIHEWFMLIPTVSEQFSDPDNVEDSLTAFQQAADTLDSTNNPGTQAAVQQQLDALDGTQYSTSSNKAIMLAIPSRILSGAAFFNVYEASTAKPVIGVDTLTTTPPNYDSFLAQRGLRVVENGVAASKVIDVESGWLVNMAIGFNVKFLLVEGYGYSEPLRTADVEIERTGNKSGSQFAFDLGMHKEFGVWNIGLVAKNIVPGNYKYGSSGDEFKIEPQLRAGFAYKRRHSVLELDIDLLENKQVGFNEPSQIGALGWEWQVWEWLALRAGYNQNLTGNEAAYGSGGIGLNISGLQIDIAALSGDEGEGVSAQLGLQF